jgi:hypothetical protein
MFKKFSAVYFLSIFGHEKPGSGLVFSYNARSGSGINESGSATLLTTYTDFCYCGKFCYTTDVKSLKFLLVFKNDQK